MTLYEIFTEIDRSQKYKHGLAENFVERRVNELSQHEFLERLSEALERRLQEL